MSAKIQFNVTIIPANCLKVLQEKSLYSHANKHLKHLQFLLLFFTDLFVNIYQGCHYLWRSVYALVNI